jgi:hypothetical protein
MRGFLFCARTSEVAVLSGNFDGELSGREPGEGVLASFSLSKGRGNARQRVTLKNELQRRVHKAPNPLKIQRKQARKQPRTE